MRWLMVLALAFAFGCGKEESKRDCRMAAEMLCKDKYKKHHEPGLDMDAYSEYQKCRVRGIMKCGAPSPRTGQ